MKNLMGVLANGYEPARGHHYAVCVQYIGEHLKEGAGDIGVEVSMQFHLWLRGCARLVLFVNAGNHSCLSSL